MEVTLQATGMFSIAGDYAAALVARQQPPRISRTSPVNPIWNSYRCSDGRWILLVNPIPYPAAWPKFCGLVGRPEWTADEYGDVMKLRAHSAALTAEVMHATWSAWYPNARVHTLPGAGHYPPQETPVAFVTEVESFLRT